MKIIKTNAIQNVTASSENSAYPAINLLDGSPKRKWQAASAAVTMASIEADVYQRTGGLGMVGIVAEEAHVTISDPNGITWENVDWSGGPGVDVIGGVVDGMDDIQDGLDDIQDGLDDIVLGDNFIGGVEWQNVPDAVLVDMSWIETGDDYKTLWVNFEQFDAAVRITIELRKSAANPNILAAGVLVVGEVFDMPYAQRPLQEGLKDLSISRELSNGAFYYKRRDIVRTFSGTVIVRRDTHFSAIMRSIARVMGGLPFMTLIAPFSMDYVVYGRFEQPPSGSHQFINHSAVSFSLIEVL